MSNHILFADNDPEFLNTRTEFLERAGYDVIKSTTLSETEWLLKNANIHLAILDIRMENDDDDRDKTGLILAMQEEYLSIPKIIITSHESADAARAALKRKFGEVAPAVDFIYKAEGPDALIDAVKAAFAHHIRINWKLFIDWKARDSFSLVRIVEPDLEGERLLNRAEELQDLFCRLFYEKESIRVDRLLWYRDGRVALVVFTFREGVKPESFIVICGQNAIVDREASRFEEFAPKAPGKSGTVLSLRAETAHFAANAYSLVGNDLEKIQTLGELYRFANEKSFNDALSTLFQITLRDWYQDKPVVERHSSPATSYRKRLELLEDYFSEAAFEERVEAIESQIATLGLSMERTNREIIIHFKNQSPTYPNPLSMLFQVPDREKSALVINVPGMLTGDNILADDSGHTWLTDFAEAGLTHHFWNYVAMEAAIRFDWVDTMDLLRRHELEHCLINTDFAKPEIRDLEPIVRKPARAIQIIRKIAVRTVGNDTVSYHQGIFFQAARRLADFHPESPVTSNELARLWHIYASMAMIAKRIGEEVKSFSAKTDDIPNPEIRIDSDAAYTLWVGKRKIRLSPKPFIVFHYLFENANHLCTKQDILKSALEDKYDERYLQALIGRIRKEIEDDPDNPSYIITERNVGYRLINKST